MKHPEQGFTLVELLVTVAIVAIVSGVLVMIVYQFLHIPRWGNAQLAVDSDLRNAGLWLTRDGNESRVFTGTVPCNTFVFDTGRGRTYTYTRNGETLLRTDSASGEMMPVGRHVTAVACPSGTLTGTVTVAVTSTRGSVSGSALVTVTMRVQ